MILPYLEENERLFGIGVDELLTVDGHKKMPEQVYRKVRPIDKKAAAAKPSENSSQKKPVKISA